MFSSDLSIDIEDALRQREEQLRFVLEGSELGFWDWNIETQSVKRNERWAITKAHKTKDRNLDWRLLQHITSQTINIADELTGVHSLN